MAYQYQLPMMAPPNGMFIYPNLATMKPDDLLATFTQAVPTVHGLYAAQTAQALQLIRTAQAVQAMHDMQTFQAQATHQVIQATQAAQAAHAVQAAQINHASLVGQAFPGSHPVAIQDGAGVSNHVNTVVQNNGGGETSTVTSPQVGIAAQGIIGGVVNKRPLNSFIAYRSYYAGAFASLPQKDISGLLRCFWKEDPFKAKWTLIAKAYSVIRDKLGLQTHRLDIFLIVNAPFLGIIPAKDYMKLLGWELKQDDDGHAVIVRSFVPDMSTFGGPITRMDQTVQEIIQHSFEQGYIPPGTPGLVVHGRMPSTFGIMLTNAATQPMPALPEEAVGTEVSPETPVATPATEAVPAMAEDLGADNASTPQEDGPNAGAEQPPVVEQGPEDIGNEAATGINEASVANEHFNHGANEVTNGATEDAPPNDGALEDNGMDELEQRLRAALEEDLAKTRDVSMSPTVAFAKRFEEAGIGYPFQGHFHPNGSPDLSFDLYQGQAFAPYDISAFIEPEFLAD